MPKEDPEKIDLNLDEQTVDEGPEDVAAAAAEAMRDAARAAGRKLPEAPAGDAAGAVAAQLAKLQAEKDELRATMVRRQADFENYKKRVERERSEGGGFRSERFFGTFHRAVPLPASVDASGVEAHFKHGVLTVKLPKRQEAEQGVQRITVKASS